MYELNEQYYDERNNRFITIYGKSRENCLCTVEGVNEYGEFYEVGDRFFTEQELSQFKKIEPQEVSK